MFELVLAEVSRLHRDLRTWRTRCRFGVLFSWTKIHGSSLRSRAAGDVSRVVLALDRTWVWRAGAVGCAAAIVAICTGVPLAEWIDKFGDNIPTDHIVQDYLKGLLWAVALGSSIPFLPVRSEDKRHLLIGWVIKGTICLTALLPYEHLYSTLPGYRYFRYPTFFTLDP